MPEVVHRRIAPTSVFNRTAAEIEISRIGDSIEGPAQCAAPWTTLQQMMRKSREAAKARGDRCTAHVFSAVFDALKNTKIASVSPDMVAALRGILSEVHLGATRDTVMLTRDRLLRAGFEMYPP